MHSSLTLSVRHSRSRWVTLMVSASLLIGVLIIGAIQHVAHAASPLVIAPQPACTQDACTGLDPLMTHCASDAQTVQTLPIIYQGTTSITTWSALPIKPGQIVGRLDKRFSISCQAIWGRVFSYIAPASNATGIFQVELDDGTNQLLAVSASAYSNMYVSLPSLTGSVTLTIGDFNRPVRIAYATLADSGTV